MVNQLVKRGVIPLDASGQIDPLIADKAYLAALHPGYEHARHARLPLDDAAETPGAGGVAVAEDVSGVAVGGDKLNGMTPYKIHATKQKQFQALLAELDYEERAARLVDVKQVEVEAFQAFREVRDGILNVADRIAGVVASVSSEADISQTERQEKIHTILTRELTEVLEGISDAIRQP
ncbi:MAG: hypothetical protein OEQ18_01640 [Gammaproteobacteria bacterium]|nr:hypothetical protein [Gammaproteobacteria bacterium]